MWSRRPELTWSISGKTVCSGTALSWSKRRGQAMRAGCYGRAAAMPIQYPTRCRFSTTARTFRGIAADSFSGLEKGGRADRSLPDVASRRGVPRVGSALGIDSRGSEKIVGARHSALQHARYRGAGSVLEGGGSGIPFVQHRTTFRKPSGASGVSDLGHGVRASDSFQSGVAPPV